LFKYCLTSAMVVLLMLTGCTSMRTIEPTPTAAQQHFKVGDIITVHTVDDTIYEFEIVEITENSIVGKRQQIPFNDIKKLQQKKIGIVKSIGAGVGITYVIITAGVAVLLFAASTL
jgi:hypothetical protein